MTPTIDRPSVPTTRELYRFTADQRRRMAAAGVPAATPPGVNGESVPVRLTGAEYDRVVELGVLGKYDKVELIDGEVLVKMSRGEPHDLALEILSGRVARMLTDEVAARCQLEVRLGDQRPEPDLVVCVPREQRRHGKPGTGELFLVVEVADSSLADDRGWKAEMYAEAGVPEYWVVNIPDQQVEVHTDPTPSGYGTRTDLSPGQVVPLVIEGVRYGDIPVADLFP